MKKHLLSLLAVLTVASASACTAVICSGKATVDGRPFIFKNRDSSSGMNNAMLQLTGTKYKFVGVFNARTTSTTSVWYGHNEAGFAILNTVIYYMNSATSSANTSAGALMKKALGQCATVDEFEQLLIQTQAGSVTLSTNFAVMDTLGNVALFETSNKSYTKFDVNDPEVAPDGYLIRTNFAFTSPFYDSTNHVGEQRYNAATRYMQETFADGAKIDPVKVVRELPRYLIHGSTGVNLWELEPEDISDVTYVRYNNFIPRYTSASAALMQGVASGEAPDHTVTWLNVGNPVCSVTVPIVINDQGAYPEIVQRITSAYTSELCDNALTLKSRMFTKLTDDNSVDTDSIDLSKLINKQQTGVMQQVVAVEDAIISRGTEIIDAMRTLPGADGSRGVRADNPDFVEYYQWVDMFWRDNFPRILKATDPQSGIDEVKTDRESNSRAAYTIDGRRVDGKLPSGTICIQDGKKILVR